MPSKYNCLFDLVCARVRACEYVQMRACKCVRACSLLICSLVSFSLVIDLIPKHKDYAVFVGPEKQSHRKVSCHFVCVCVRRVHERVRVRRVLRVCVFEHRVCERQVQGNH